MWNANPYNGLNNNNVDNDNNGARPVISLKPEYNSFTYGNGTGANPYRFVATIPAGDNDEGEIIGSS